MTIICWASIWTSFFTSHWAHTSSINDQQSTRAARQFPKLAHGTLHSHRHPAGAFAYWTMALINVSAAPGQCTASTKYQCTIFLWMSDRFSHSLQWLSAGRCMDRIRKNCKCIGFEMPAGVHNSHKVPGCQAGIHPQAIKPPDRQRPKPSIQQIDINITQMLQQQRQPYYNNVKITMHYINKASWIYLDHATRRLPSLLGNIKPKWIGQVIGFKKSRGDNFVNTLNNIATMANKHYNRITTFYNHFKRMPRRFMCIMLIFAHDPHAMNLLMTQYSVASYDIDADRYDHIYIQPERHVL